MNNAAPTFYNRPAIEREIESIENPHGMRLNDAKERAILPAGTLRRLLVVIDAQAGRIAELEAQLASGQEPTRPAPESWRTLLQLSQANSVRNFGPNGMADWVYNDLRELFADGESLKPITSGQGPTVSKSDWDLILESAIPGKTGYSADALKFAYEYGKRAQLASGQEPLGPEFEKVLHDNLWGLYETDSGQQPVQIPAEIVKYAKAMQPNSVKIPTSADEAALMSLLGEAWLKDHAPDRLRTAPAQQSLSEAYEKGWREAAKWANRGDLVSDIGSPAYLQDMAAHGIKEMQ